MDALLVRCAILAAAIASLGASSRTANFIVEAPTQDAADKIGAAAEKFRTELATEWLGQPMPNWAHPCPITAQVADHLGAGGATSFVFEHGEVYGWKMTIQGSLLRILDSVLPHEVTHTIFATHFRQPLPRWADEGACTTVEHISERQKQQTMLIDFLRTGRGIAFSQMFAMREYPHDVMPLYSQGYSVARYLVAQGGKKKFLDYIADGLKDENWGRATQRHYGHANLAILQNDWLDWVRQGSPAIQAAPETPALVAVKTPGTGKARPDANLLRRDAATLASASEDDGYNATNPNGSGRSVYELASNTSDIKPQPEPDEWRPHEPRMTALATADSPLPAPEKELPLAKSQPGKQIEPAHQATRPQAIQRPRQVILEWNRPPGSAPAPAPPVPGPG